MAWDTTDTPQSCDRKGADLSLYYNTGTCEVPVWVFHRGIVGDLTVNDADDEEELAIRDPDQNFKLYSPGKTDLSVSGEQLLDPTYEGAHLFNTMRRGGAPADLLVLTGSIEDVGNVGYRGAFWNMDRGWNGPETGNATQNFNLRPAACQDCPITTVRVEEAGEIVDYDPGVFVPAS